MKYITYEDVLEVMDNDSRFKKKMLTVSYCKELKENYPGYNKELENRLFYDACSLDNFKVVKYFIKNSEFSQVALNAGLNNAVTKRNYKIASFLIDNGADPSVSKNYPVKKAAIDSQIKFLKKVQKKGFDLSFDDDCLLDCAMNSSVKWKLIEYLIESGLRNQEYLDSLLRTALMQDNVYMVNFLIEKGANPETCKYLFVKFMYK